MFTLSDNQRTLLLAARAAQEEGERRFDFWGRRETLRAASEAFGQTLTDSGLAQGQGLTDETRTRLTRLAAELSPNPNLSRRLWAHGPADFDRRLRLLLFGQAGLYERLREFLSVRGTGLLTASQLLCAFAPSEFPLVTRPALRRLRLSAAQMRDALADAADRYGFTLSPEPDAAARLLALFCVYETARTVLGTASFADTEIALRQTWPAALSTPPAASGLVQEEGASYGTPAPARTEAALLEALEASISAQGFHFPPGLVRAYYVSLKTRPFAILSGASGTGKTRLAELFAEFLTGRDPSQFRLLPVRPDWADAAPLLGYHNVLANRYVSAPFLEMARAAARPENRRRAYFLCLDEMNLARVEHYLSDYLSALEARDPRIPLHEGVPDLVLPPNLFVTGTVNVDETTHAFSKKVLDRANTLDFEAPPRLSEWGEAEKGLAVEGADVLTPAERQEVFLRGRVPTVGAARARLKQIDPSYEERAVAALSTVNDILYPHRLHVAYRVRDDLLRFLAHAWDSETRQGLLTPVSGENLNIGLDLQMCQKVLPRLNGMAETLETALAQLERWAQDWPLPRTATRLARMRAHGAATGYVRFHE